MFSPISSKLYLQSTKNNLQSVKNRTTNAVKPVSKKANERFCRILGNDIFD